MPFQSDNGETRLEAFIEGEAGLKNGNTAVFGNQAPSMGNAGAVFLSVITSPYIYRQGGLQGTAESAGERTILNRNGDL